jgi:PucR family transcriptional regulator, purine catabolism regulatory protein
MRGGELLLTTAYPIRDDPSALGRLIPELADRGLAGLGIKIGPYLDALPSAMISAADKLDFPVIEVPPDVVFNDILVEVLGTILNRQAVELERSQAPSTSASRPCRSRADRASSSSRRWRS